MINCLIKRSYYRKKLEIGMVPVHLFAFKQGFKFYPTQVRAAVLKSNKASTLYNTDSYCVALAANSEGTGFLSGHADGSVVRWYLVDDPNSKGQVSRNAC